MSDTDTTTPRHADGPLSGSDALSSSRGLVNALRELLARETSSRVELIETHISWVLLAGAYAYKIKRPVRLSFVDFSTLALRRHFCDEELRLNRRFAPQLYIGVVPITGNRSGAALGRHGRRDRVRAEDAPHARRRPGGRAPVGRHLG